MKFYGRPMGGVILCLALLFAGAFWVRHQLRKAPVARLLPSGTLLWIEIPKIQETRVRYADTAMAKMLREPNVDPMLKTILNAQLDRLPKSREGALLLKDLLRLLSLVNEEVFVAITDVSISPRLDVGILAGVQLPPRNILQSENWGNEVLRRWQIKYPLAQAETRAAGGIKYQVWNLKPGIMVASSRIGRTLLFSYGEQPLREALERYAGEREDSMDRSRHYTMIRSRSQSADAWVYLNPRALLDGFKTLLSLQLDLQNWFDYHGLPRSIFATVNFKDGGVEEVLWIHRADQVEGEIGESLRKCKGSTLAAVSAEVYICGVMGIDLTSWSERISKEFDGLGGELILKRIHDFWKGTDWEHFRWKEEILTQLGSEFAIAGGWREGQWFPEGVLIFEIQQNRQIKTLTTGCEKIFKILQKEWGTKARLESFRGSENAMICVLRHPDTQGWLSPCFAITDRFLILSPNLAGLETSLKTLARASPGLTSTSQFQNVLSRFPKTYSQMFYCDEKRLFEKFYHAGSTVVALQKHSGTFQMPSSQDLARHLFPGVWMALTEDETYRMISFGPIGIASCFAAAATILEKTVCESP